MLLSSHGGIPGFYVQTDWSSQPTMMQLAGGMDGGFLLFLPQGNDRIDERGAARRNKTCQCGYGRKDQRYRGDNCDVVGAKAVEQVGEEASRVIQRSKDPRIQRSVIQD